MDEARNRFHEVVESHKRFFLAYRELVLAVLPTAVPAVVPLFETAHRQHDRLAKALLAAVVPIYREPGEAFWNGFAMGLLTAERLDLLEHYPDAELAAGRIEAEQILASPPPPPFS